MPPWFHPAKRRIFPGKFRAAPVDCGMIVAQTGDAFQSRRKQKR
jgi:hypothetical protein